MKSTESVLGAFGRIVGGLFAGAVLGLLIEGLYLESRPPEDKRILLIGPGIVGVILATVAFYFGECELNGWFKIVSISFLTGVAIGGIGGATVFPTIMVAMEGFDPLFHEKIHAAYANVGAIFGIPTGSGRENQVCCPANLAAEQASASPVHGAFRAAVLGPPFTAGAALSNPFRGASFTRLLAGLALAAGSAHG